MTKPFSLRHADTVVDIMASAAAQEIMPRFSGAMPNRTTQKTTAFDIVTEADEAAELRISAQLRAEFPGAALIGEEAVFRDASLLAQIATADLAFIIDPIDGTRNFASGVPLFGVMVAATVRGEVVFGAIHDPVCGDTAVAVRGEGAWRQGGGRPRADLRVADPVPLDQIQAVAGTNFLPEPLRSTVAGNLSRISLNFWLRCAAHEYRLAAAGHCHVLVYNKLMPWDHAAGWLLHREAGGYSAHFDGSPYLPTHTSGGLICATDAQSWALVRSALLDAPAAPRS
ncbi:inositol monophosphatase family protein [Variovorax sp. W6]|uniref:inositol monophosphatase family protein n=1 Tax=Variovorax sp. W6 TaxID=3093895 RepID=UPI003D809C8E